MTTTMLKAPNFGIGDLITLSWLVYCEYERELGMEETYLTQLNNEEAFQAWKRDRAPFLLDEASLTPRQTAWKGLGIFDDAVAISPPKGLRTSAASLSTAVNAELRYMKETTPIGGGHKIDINAIPTRFDLWHNAITNEEMRSLRVFMRKKKKHIRKSGRITSFPGFTLPSQSSYVSARNETSQRIVPSVMAYFPMASKIERCIPPHTLLDILSLHLSEPLREDPSKHHVYTQGKLVAYEMAAQPMGFLYRHNADLRTLLSSLAVSAKGIATTDNGMAHFFSSIGVPTMIASSATNPALVYDHYPDIGIANVAVAQPIMHPDNTCVGCYFSPDHGFRIACRLGGCREIASGPANMFYILSQSLVQETNQEIFITEKELMNGLEELEGPEKDQTVEPRKPTIH